MELEELTTSLKQERFDPYNVAVEKEVVNVKSEPTADPLNLDQDSEKLLIKIMLGVLKGWEDKFLNPMSFTLRTKATKIIALTEVVKVKFTFPLSSATLFNI